MKCLQSIFVALVPLFFYSGQTDAVPHNRRGSQPSGHWVDTWVSMPQLTEYTNLPNPPFNQSNLVFFNSTIRQTLHMSIGAPTIRIRISNAFGVNNLPITAVTVAQPVPGVNASAGASAILPQTLQTVTFSGSPNITIPDGSLAVSDPLNFPIQPLSTITVTMYLAEGQASNLITSHPGSRTNIYYSFGNYVDAVNMTDPSTQTVQHWYFVSAVEAWVPKTDRSFVIIGDSITDGRESDNNANNRWPDLLLTRMQKDPYLSKIAVLNQAAGGNRILYDGNGPNALSRIDRDVLSHPSVAYAMIFEGVNDIGVTPADPEAQTAVGDRLINAIKQISVRVHEFGIPLFAATITPFSGNATIQPYSDPVRENTRQRVNTFIRNSGGAFDAVVDFDKLIADPGNPAELNPIYNSGDYLHPNVAGYTLLADSFPLGVFSQFRLGVSGFQ